MHRESSTRQVIRLATTRTAPFWARLRRVLEKINNPNQPTQLEATLKNCGNSRSRNSRGLDPAGPRPQKRRWKILNHVLISGAPHLHHSRQMEVPKKESRAHSFLEPRKKPTPLGRPGLRGTSRPLRATVKTLMEKNE